MLPRLPVHLGFIRNLLRRLNYHLQPAAPGPPPEPFNPQLLATAEAALRALPMPHEDARAYLAKHIPRLARTLALIPKSGPGGSILELGCYMQITPLLQQLCGYQEVRGAYFGPPGRIDHKVMGDFSCDVDHFNAERDPFPYPEGHFDVVLAGEIIEHMIYDPMHLLLEARRVLREGGHLLVTTPNVGSITSAAKALDGRDNPQIFFLYERPAPGQEPDIGHVREYTAHEIGAAVVAAGFEIVSLFTTHIAEFASHLPLLQFLAENGYSTEHRGEQTWCLAVKREALPVDRFPWFIYNP